MAQLTPPGDRRPSGPRAPRAPRLRDLAPSYGAFVVDVWGVLCDGKRSFPNPVAALDRMRDFGPVALLSNTARRAAALSEFLAALGIERDRYDVVITAGEACHAALRQGSWTGAGRRRSKTLYYVGPERDRLILQATGVQSSEVLEDAGAILCTGLLDGLSSVERHLPTLLRGLRLGLPLICANPDKQVWIGSRLTPCAGSLADRYEDLGGRVLRFGKPERPVYDACLADLSGLRSGLEPSSILAIGDGMETDIVGAVAQGFDSLFVESGLSADSKPLRGDADLGPAPTYSMPELSW